MTVDNKIFVTRPSLPSLEELQPYLAEIWNARILTNQGKFHELFEHKLGKYLGVKYLSLFANGTIALLTALKALDISGEVITTPYSFVATAHTISWAGLKPVFADILPGSWTLDPARISEAITPATSAILPVHVYGNPCKVDEIQKIAGENGLKVIYDACHTFGEKTGTIPLVSLGDMSVMSFHATKVFTTFEGGAVITGSAEMKNKVDLLRNFGFTGETSVTSQGINGKMNEFQAALGLLQLQKIDSYIKKRKTIAECYLSELQDVDGLLLPDNRSETSCYSYFPVFVDEMKYGKPRDALYVKLKQSNIYCRRYFYPLISQFEPYKMLESARPGNSPVAGKAAGEVLCLPIYPELSISEVITICKVIRNFGSSRLR